MAGQSVGLVDQVMPLETIMEEFLQDGEAELGRLKAWLSAWVPKIQRLLEFKALYHQQRMQTSST